MRSNRRLRIHDETFLPLTHYPVQRKRSLSQTAAHPIRYHIHGERPLVEYRSRQNCGPQIFGYCRLSFEQRHLRRFHPRANFLGRSRANNFRASPHLRVAATQPHVSKRILKYIPLSLTSDCEELAARRERFSLDRSSLQQ